MDKKRDAAVPVNGSDGVKLVSALTRQQLVEQAMRHAIHAVAQARSQITAWGDDIREGPDSVHHAAHALRALDVWWGGLEGEMRVLDVKIHRIAEQTGDL